MGSYDELDDYDTLAGESTSSVPEPSEVLNRQAIRRESLEELLQQLYNPCIRGRDGSVCESESWTDQSNELGNPEARHIANGGRLTEASLRTLGIDDLNKLIAQLRHETYLTSQRLVRALRRRSPQMSCHQSLCNFLSAILQAHSLKRSEDTKLKFSLEPMAGEDGYQQWLNAMKAVARLPGGMPQHFRRKLWLTVANNYLKTASIDWDEVRTHCFCEKLNPDDNELTLQIVKDLHRTGWSGYSNDRDRIMLKRVLLAYARYNKAIGYCQGFNVIAALIMEVMDNKEDQALKVMIMLVEHVLPRGYFDQTLRALSVDMTVLKDLMALRLPSLYAHLQLLQKNSACDYEPPLMNVFSMQWFLTIFATVFPKYLVFRIWDSLILEGSEVLLRVALAIFAKISSRSKAATSADAFYELMSRVSRRLQTMSKAQSESLMQLVYNMAEFPFPGLEELRDRHLWNIQPFSSGFSLFRHQVISILKTDNDLPSSNDKVPKKVSLREGKKRPEEQSISDLKKQYKQMKQRQKQAKLFLEGGLLNQMRNERNSSSGSDSYVFNHLFVSNRGRNAMPMPSKPLSESVSVAPCLVQPVNSNARHGSRRSSCAPSSNCRSGTLSTERTHSMESSPSVSCKSNDWILSVSRRPSNFDTRPMHSYRSLTCITQVGGSYSNLAEKSIECSARSSSCISLKWSCDEDVGRDFSQPAQHCTGRPGSNNTAECMHDIPEWNCPSANREQVVNCCHSNNEDITRVNEQASTAIQKAMKQSARLSKQNAYLEKSRAIIDSVATRKQQPQMGTRPLEPCRSRIVQNGRRYGLYGYQTAD
ncbi:RabGAP-TBC domain containing protein [Trichuris trichiura]|uniref:RabGAP-TBC domain containing protein n=1 Tax=Trichuris trichiura TaxID=36087 RepID=A0A077Z0Z9_TRITR|nr:RabGAP-TBC domain containing protein [Trichuris trichiura]